MGETRACFEVLQGRVLVQGARVDRVTLGPGATRLGRRETSDVVLVDPHVSRVQLEAELSPTGGCTIQVPETASPVLVEGRRVVGSLLLHPEDQLQVGGIVLRYRGPPSGDESHATLTAVRREEESGISHLVLEGAPPAPRRSGRYLQLLGELGDSLLHIDDPIRMRRRMLQLVLEHLPVTRALIAMLPEGGERLLPETWLVDPDDPEGGSFELSASLLERIMDEEAVCAFEEAGQVGAGQSVHAASIRSAMGAALRDADRIRGVLYADNRKHGVSFSDEDRAFFAALAGLVATTLRASRRVAALVQSLPAEDLEDGQRRMIGVSPAMCALGQRAQRLAQLRAPVLILGERGTGKGLTARYLHRHSSRAEDPFVHVNCASIPPTLAEAELFGIAPGSGVANAPAAGRPGYFQAARGGTIFLDEVGDLPPEVQPKLLVALREGLVTPVGSPRAEPVDVRVVAATNRDLESLARNERFRMDLLDRLGALRLEMPPLRERPGDLPHLARYLLACLLREEQWDRELALSEEAILALERRSWPGNVAQLENVLREAMAFADGEVLEAGDLPPPGRDEERALPETPLLSLAAAEALHIQEVLQRLGWNKTRAARVLGIARNTLDEKIRRHGLTPPSGIEVRRGRRRGRTRTGERSTEARDGSDRRQD